MSASRTSTEFLSFPECENCHLDFDEDDSKPLLLPCQHAFCRSCLNDQEDEECQNCPTCSESWADSNVAKLPVVYDLIPPGEGVTGREVLPDGRFTSSNSSGRKMAPAPTGREVTPMATGREVTPASHGRTSAARQARKKSSARFPVCAVCSEDYNMNFQLPLKLPCGHCFCRTCLEILRNSSKSTCPQCRGEWATVDMNRLPIVKSLIHPSNTNKNVPRAQSAAAGQGHAGMSDDDKLRVAQTLRLRSNAQTKQTESQIFVTDTQNRTHTLRLNLQTATVTQLRTLVAEVTGVEPQHQRLVFGTQQLEDGRTLAQCRIKANDRLTLTCRLRGGL